MPPVPRPNDDDIPEVFRAAFEEEHTVDLPADEFRAAPESSVMMGIIRMSPIPLSKEEMDRMMRGDPMTGLVISVERLTALQDWASHNTHPDVEFKYSFYCGVTAVLQWLFAEGARPDLLDLQTRPRDIDESEV